VLLFSTLLERGDEIILSNPYYPCYPNIIQFSDGVPVFVDVMEEEGFQYLPEMIQKRLNGRTKGIVINSPSNPTGNVMDGKRMAEIAKLSPFIVSDEIYHGLVYEGTAPSILEFARPGFVIMDFRSFTP
jgi:aspartate/methionine/tyrosine aminotransferase